MAKAIDPKFTNLLDDFQCVICLGEVNDVQQCPHCSKIFCKTCILEWLKTSSNCPNCRKAVNQNSLVKGCFVNQIMESVKQAVADLEISGKDDHCSQHAKQQLSMFCYTCEDSICTECFFSKEHAGHKDKIVPLGKAFKDFQNKLKGASFVNIVRKEKVKVALAKLQEVECLFRNNLESIDKIQKESEALLASSEANPAAMKKIMKLEKSVAEFPNEYELLPQCVLNPSSTVLLVQISGSGERNKPPFEFHLQSSCGFEWKITIDNEESLNGKIVWDVNVRMIRGIPGRYSVCFGNEKEKLTNFKLNQNVTIGEVMAGTSECELLRIHVKKMKLD